MPKINFDMSIASDQKSAFKKIKKFMSSENDFKKFDPKVKCTFNDEDYSCQIEGTQFNAHIKTTEEKTKTKVEVSIEIPIPLVLFKGKIKEIVEKNIKKIFKT